MTTSKFSIAAVLMFLMAPYGLAQKTGTRIHHSPLSALVSGCIHDGEPCSTAAASTGTRQATKPQLDLDRLERQQVNALRNNPTNRNLGAVRSTAFREPIIRSSTINFTYQPPRVATPSIIKSSSRSR